MKIQFVRLEIQNFGSFTKLQLLDLSKLEVGVHFVCGDNQVDKRLGSNGAGKSTLLNAIAWCLYGKTSVGLKSADIKPWSKAGTPHVGLAVRLDGKRRLIERTAPNHIQLDGKEVGQDEIDRLFHMSYAVFKQTVLFGQQEPLFFDLPNKDKLALLSDVLELDRWDVRSQKAAERTRELEDKQHELNVVVMGIENAQSNNKELMAGAMRAGDEWEAKLAERLKNFYEEKRATRLELADIEKKLAAASRIAKTAAERLGEAQANMQIAQNHVRDIERKQAVELAEVRALEREAKQLKDTIGDLADTDTCPTCDQPLTGTELAKHLKIQRAKLKEIEASITEKVKPKKVDVKAHHMHQFITAKGTSVNQQTELDFRKGEVDKYTRQAIELTTRFEALREQTKEREVERNPYTAQLKTLKKQANELKTQKVTAENERAKAIRRAARSKYWIKGFKDLRLFVIEDVLQELEMVTNSILQDMGLSDWMVRYAVERETQTGTVQTGMMVSVLSPRNSKPVKWEAWSGGEGQRLRLAGALALSEVLLDHAGIEIDMEILDEPSKHIDDEGVVDLCEMLAARADQLQRRILYIDHRVIESASFASTITVTKTKEGSKLLSP